MHLEQQVSAEFESEARTWKGTDHFETPGRLNVLGSSQSLLLGMVLLQPRE